MRNVVLFMANAPLVIAFSADTDQKREKRLIPSLFLRKSLRRSLKY